MTGCVQSRSFGDTRCGESVEVWTLRGAGGMELEAITYGGIVRRLIVNDANGDSADVVVGLRTLEEYLTGHPYFGAIVGRVAGRISDGLIKVDGLGYQLAVNDPPNHLHGGERGFDKRVWAAEVVTRSDKWPSVRFRLESADGHQGYPGALHCSITYTVTPNNAFVVESEVSAERPTPVTSPITRTSIWAVKQAETFPSICFRSTPITIFRLGLISRCSIGSKLFEADSTISYAPGAAGMRYRGCSDSTDLCSWSNVITVAIWPVRHA